MEEIKLQKERAYLRCIGKFDVQTSVVAHIMCEPNITNNSNFLSSPSIVLFMIETIIFDLDDVLDQIDKLKLLAYAKAVQRIQGLNEPDFCASYAYPEVIGGVKGDCLNPCYRQVCTRE